MATRANLIATYQNNPTLQSQYTQQQYLDLFDFGQSTPQPAPNPPPTRTPPADGIQNIIGQNLNQGGGGGGAISTSIGNVSNKSGLIGDFMSATQQRQNRLTNPGKIASFVGDFIPQQRDIGAMIKSGVADERLTSGIPLGISGIIAKALPDKYYDMPLEDQIFIQSQMGYTGPTVFGENNMPNKDPFGINVRSAFGDYGAYVSDRVEELEGIVEDQYARGLTNTIQMKELAFRTKQDKVQKEIKERVEKQRQEEIDRANKEAAVAARVARGESLSDIGKDMYTGSGQAFEAGRTDAGGGFTGGKTVDSPSTPGGKYSSPRKDGGLMYADGGRVYLYNRLK